MKNNNKLKGKQLLKNMKKSFGCVTIFNGDDEVCAYKGCVYQKKNFFASLIQDFCFNDAYRYEIEFRHLKRSIPAISLARDPETGLTIFELQNDLCESLDPLKGEPKGEIKKGDVVFLPEVQFGDRLRSLIPGSICEIEDDSFRTNYYVDERVLGSPLLNSSGNVIGIINSLCDLNKKDLSDIDDSINALSRVVAAPQFVSGIHSQYNWMGAAASVNIIHSMGNFAL